MERLKSEISGMFLATFEHWGLNKWRFIKLIVLQRYLGTEYTSSTEG